MISKKFEVFANQNAFPANFPKKAAKNHANLKGDSSKFNSLFYRFTCYQIRHIWVSHRFYIKQSLESYITFHTAANLGSYGMDEITDFNIYCEARGNGEYLIYFLFA